MGGRRGSIVRVALVAAVAASGVAGASPAAPCPAVPTVDDRCEAWSESFDHPGGRGGFGEDLGFHIAANPVRDQVYVTGASYDDSTRYDVVTIAYREDGTEAWRARFDGAGDDDAAYEVAVTADGATVVVAGFSTQASGDEDAVALGYDAATGALRWKATVAQSASDDIAWAVTADSERVYVAGVRARTSTAGTGDLFVSALDASTGSASWTSTYSLAGRDEAYDVAVAGGTVFVTGYSNGGSTGDDLVTLAYDGATGAQAWIDRYDSGVKNSDYGYAIEATAGGAVYVTGGSRLPNGVQFSSGWDYVTLAYDGATGARSWVNRYDGTARMDDDASDVAVSPDGSRVFVTGRSSDRVTGNDAATIAYDAATGATAWTARVTVGSRGETGSSLAVTPDGASVVLAASSAGPRAAFGVQGNGVSLPPTTSYLTTALDTTDGSARWSALYNRQPADDDVASAVAIDGTGRKAFVVGTTRAQDPRYPADNDITTIAYLL